VVGRENGYCTFCASLIPWSSVLLEKLTVTQLVKEFPSFFGNRRFITVFTRVRHWSLPEPDESSPHLPNLTD